MNKAQLAQLHSLSKKDKLKIVHLLWDDIAKEQEELSVPSEHLKIIDERFSKIQSGQSEFKSWEEIKAKYKSA